MVEIEGSGSAPPAMQTSSMHENVDSASTRNMLAAFKASASERPTRVTKLQHDLAHNTTCWYVMVTSKAENLS